MSSDFEQKTIDLIISLIRTRYNKKNADFAKLCGLTVPALSRFVNKQHTNIGLHTFLKMCVLLDIKIICEFRRLEDRKNISSTIFNSKLAGEPKKVY